MKYWEILLIKQKERDKKGLTLPFLIGSQKYLPSHYQTQNIRDLIIEMTNKNSFETCLRFCTSTQSFIFEIRNPENNVYFPKINQNEQNGLSVSLFDKINFGETIDVMIEKLEEIFQKPIKDGKFSAESNVEGRSADWRSFTFEDIKFINDSFEKLQQSS
jgi:hypothetical protein